MKAETGEHADVAFDVPHDVDRSYVRCANILLIGMLRHRTRARGRRKGSDEYQMLYGSGLTSSAGWRRKGRPCACTYRSASSGTAT